MTNFILNNEPIIRTSFFFGILAIMILWELLSPKRRLNMRKSTRWFNNFLLVILNSIILRLLAPAGAMLMVLYMQDEHWGLFNRVNLPFWLEAFLAIILLDLAIYWQHRLFHKVPFLWRLHRVHHVDQDIDVSTGSRFHPIEIVLSFGIKCLMIMILGPSILAVLIFEILLNVCAMFNHANISLNTKLDQYLRLLLVTPDMHRVHHSQIKSETNSNYGFNVPYWDRLFGSYIAQPLKGHAAMVIGVRGFNETKETQHLWSMLLLPFKNHVNPLKTDD